MRMSWVRVSPKPPPILSDWHWFFSIYILCTLQPAEVYGVLAQSAEQTPYKCQGRGSIPRNTTRESNPPSQRDAKSKKHYCFLYGCCYDSILVFESWQYVCGLLLARTGWVLCGFMGRSTVVVKRSAKPLVWVRFSPFPPNPSNIHCKNLQSRSRHRKRLLP